MSDWRDDYLPPNRSVTIYTNMSPPMVVELTLARVLATVATDGIDATPLHLAEVCRGEYTRDGFDVEWSFTGCVAGQSLRRAKMSTTASQVLDLCLVPELRRENAWAAKRQPTELERQREATRAERRLASPSMHVVFTGAERIIARRNGI